MASAILRSAKHGAYLAIGLYVTMILVVTLGVEFQSSVEAPIQVANPGIQFDHRAHNVVVDRSEIAGVAGA